MSENGQNGHSITPFPGIGLWLLVIDGGCAYFAMTTTPRTEEDVAGELDLTGQVKLTLRPIYVLDSVRGAVGNANRGLDPISIPIAQRIDQRIGLPDDFPVHITAHAVVFLSEVSPDTRAALLDVATVADRAILEQRAKQIGLVTATR